MLQSAPPVFRLCDLVRISARRQPDAIAIEHDVGRMTYRQFDERALKCANVLIGQGLKPGDRVVVFARNGHEFLELYMGLQFAGLVAVPVNFRLSAAELAYVLTNSGARGIAIGEEFLRTYELASAQVAVAPHAVIVIGPASDHATAYERLLAKASSEEPMQLTSAFSPAAIFYTSGTTGFPKGAVMSHLALLMRFSSWGWRFGITEEDVLLVPGPVFHQSFGSISILSLCTGARLVLHTDFDAPAVIDALCNRGITWSFMVPKMHTGIVEAIGNGASLQGCDSLRGLMSSGSTLATPVLRGLVEAFPKARLCDTYGWTESGWITYCRHEDVTRGTRTVGKVSYGCELAILDDDGNVLPAGEVGQIYAANPIPFMGYHENPEATAAMRKGKWETGGDVGMLDEQGFLQIFDRKRDMIVSGGENIYPAEIERVLAEHPKVLEVAVVGVPDAQWGESPRACVVPKAGEIVSDAELLGFCVDKLAKFKHPKSVCMFDVLPRNSMGKVLRRELRDRFWNESKAA
jgi:acyl-CoA synthetase (AMP-forming)/AMP-acid ligase II